MSTVVTSNNNMEFEEARLAEYEHKIKDLTPTEQEAVRKFWRSVVLRTPRAFSEENGRLPQCAANVRSCNCCPYGYHIDLDFVRYCEALANAKPSEEELRRRSRRRSRKSMEFMLGLDGLFDQWDAAMRVEPLPEASHESDSPDSSRPALTASTPYGQRPRSSSMPRFTYSGPTRSESPFGTASSTCSSLRGGVESDAPYPVRRRLNTYANSPPETRAFLHDALDEVCSDFERTLERASVRRKKAATSTPNGDRGLSYASLMTRSDRNNNSPSYNDRKLNGHGNFMTMSCLEQKRSCYTWDQYFDRTDSCVAGNKSSPRFTKSHGSLPFQQKPSPAEQQYEQHVQATVAANAKSPIELDRPGTSDGCRPISASPPPPPPRRHGASTVSATVTSAGLQLSCSSTELSPLTSEAASTEGEGKSAAVVDGPDQKIEDAMSPTTQVNGGGEGSASADAQTLFNIRQQMALSLSRMQDLEEQVKTIPELQLELAKAREEKYRLLQALNRKDDELLRLREQQPRLSASPSPGASPKHASPVQFTPQRISPVSLESLGARLRTSSTSSERQARSTTSLKRDVGTMCGLHTTRDVAVGSTLTAQRSTGTSAGVGSITENLYTEEQLAEATRTAVRLYEEQRSLQQLRKLISIGTQMYTPPPTRDARDHASQTVPERSPNKYSVGVSARPTTRDAYVTCKPSQRSLGVSDDTTAEAECAKCAVPKRSVSCGPEQTPASGESEALLAMPGRSLSFSVGASQELGVRRKTQGTQYTATTVQSSGSQTSLGVVHSVGVQNTPETLVAATQSDTDIAHRNTQHTDTRDLLKLSVSKTRVEEVAAPVPQPEPQPPKPITHSRGSNTEPPAATKSSGVNTPPPAALRSSASNTEPLPPPEEAAKPPTRSTACNTDVPRTLDNGVNTPPAATTRSAASNTEEVHKRDIGCGGDQTATLKPHISIACAANYCDSCKDSIKHLAKQFATKAAHSVPASPLPTRAVDSKIPRPKNLVSPVPVRRTFQRQNTYTVSSPTKAKSPGVERKQMTRSLSEKRPSLSSGFRQSESAGETRTNISDGTRRPQHRFAGSARNLSSSGSSSASGSGRSKSTVVERKERSGTALRVSPTVTLIPSKSQSHEFSHIGIDDLIVREEKRVSISWSRDASPAPQTSRSSPAPQTSRRSPPKSLESSLKGSLDSTEPSCSKASKVDCSKGAHRKTPSPTLKASSRNVAGEEGAALKQKRAMAEAQPRQKYDPPRDVRCALKVINESLLKKVAGRRSSSSVLLAARATIMKEWFHVSSTEDASPHEVEDYLDCFEGFSVPLLEYIVNMPDANANTAMHYSVSHANFDVVSILLDSKVCNVNQMNNAGYTPVMLVSLAKLKDPAHHTVVERLFQMADVNIRAKKHSQTALMLAVSHGNLDMVTLLLGAGADVNIQDEDGSTALMCAAEHGRVDIVKLLLSQQDCDSLIQDADKSTAFKIAWQAGFRDLGLLLYVHEQMLRSRLPNRGEGYGEKLGPVPRDNRPSKPTQ